MESKIYDTKRKLSVVGMSISPKFRVHNPHINKKYFRILYSDIIRLFGVSL